MINKELLILQKEEIKELGKATSLTLGLGPALELSIGGAAPNVQEN